MTKNLHIEHPEDEVLTGNLSVFDWFCEPKSIASVKIDGAPAIVWGINPANGKFFVGTKSVFNKVKIKINHSHEEIDANHDGKVALILHSAFDCLPRNDRGIYQGDFIGFGGQSVYRPNTITYKFDEVIEQEFIIAPHTSYVAESDLRDAVAYPGCPQFASTKDCYFVRPKAYVLPEIEELTELCSFAKQMAQLAEFITPKQATAVKKVINSYIRQGIDPSETELAEATQCDINLIRLWKLAASIKDRMFLYVHDDCTVKCEIDGQQSFHEGYVVSNEFGLYKLVDRMEFSRQNFNLAKNW